jgi:hypothetical protein
MCWFITTHKKHNTKLYMYDSKHILEITHIFTVVLKGFVWGILNYLYSIRNPNRRYIEEKNMSIKEGYDDHNCFNKSIHIS